MKKIFTYAVIAGILSSMTLPVFAEETETTTEELSDAIESSGDTIILYTNDVHCAVSPDEDKGVLGYTAVAGLKKSLEAEGNSVALVDIGDSIQGDAIGTLSDGTYIVDIMNAVGYDVAIPGNHEFDYGMDQFLSLTKEAAFPYVSCNFTDITTGKTVLSPYEILQIGDLSVAFVGICTPKTITSSTPAYFQNDKGEYIYNFQQGNNGQDLYDSVQTAVNSALAEGADYVVALAHLGIESACSPWMSSEVINNTNGIDVMLDGHSHSTLESEFVKNKLGEDVLVSSTGSKLAAVGKLTIAKDGTLSTELVTDCPTDPDTDEYIAGIESQFEAILGEVIGKTDVDLIINEPSSSDSSEKIRIVRNSETNLGDFCADAYRYVSGADIAFVNGGGVRSEIPAGDITYQDVINVHPFGNEICMVEATGQQILDALEMGVMAMPEEFGGFPQVSGITFEIDMEKDSSVTLDENGMFKSIDGDRRIQNVMVGEEPLDPAKTYTLASHNYLLKNGGDGMNMFTDCKLVLEDIMLDNQALMTYIKDSLGGVIGEEYSNPYGSERIVAINDDGVAEAEETTVSK